ncbi:endonuclease domain-containing protein [Arthrobacter sp. C152]
MKTPSPLPAHLLSLPFTFREAVDAGISLRRLRHHALSAPSRGIRIPDLAALAGPEDTPRPEVVRPFTTITEFSAASHATAFRFWQFPAYLPGENDPRIHISRPDTMAIPRRKGVIGHVGQFFDDEVVCVDGLLVTSRPRTWLDNARRMSVEELTVVADHLVRIPRAAFESRLEPHCSLEELAQMLDRHKGTPGIRKARLALDQARVGSDSAPETRLRLALENAGLPKPQLNLPTQLCAGVVRQPDLSYPERRVAVEYDGESHSIAGQVVKDIAREEDFNRAGWLLVRISRRHMDNGARHAVSKVRAALQSRGWSQ